MEPEEIKLIQTKLCDKLKSSEWFNKLKGFILSDDFYKILVTLVNQSLNNKRFTPALKNIFKCFELCHYNKLKVIFINENAYSQIGVADGLAFSASDIKGEPLNLRLLLDSLEHQYPEFKRKNDLSNWAEQGVLLLNLGITANINSSTSHIDLWKPMINYLIDMLNTYDTGLIFVLFGKKAHDYEELISENHYKILVDDPLESINSGKIWNSNNLFKKIETILLENNNTKISW